MTTDGGVIAEILGVPPEVRYRFRPWTDDEADVFLDDTLQETVDCFFPECPLPYQFAFIKTGLDPRCSHTIRILVRGDQNPGSSGTTIRHLGFEFGGRICYRAWKWVVKNPMATSTQANVDRLIPHRSKPT